MKQDSLSMPSTSNGGSHHYAKGGHSNSSMHENNGHFVHYPYGDVPANPVACEIATPISSYGTISDKKISGTNAASHLGVIKRRAHGWTIILVY